MATPVEPERNALDAVEIRADARRDRSPPPCARARRGPPPAPRVARGAGCACPRPRAPLFTRSGSPGRAPSGAPPRASWPAFQARTASEVKEGTKLTITTPPFFGSSAQHVVRHVARMVDERARRGVGEDHRRLRRPRAPSSSSPARRARGRPACRAGSSRAPPPRRSGSGRRAAARRSPSRPSRCSS